MNSEELHLTIGKDSRVLSVNEAVCLLIDKPTEALVSELVLDLIAPDDHKTFVNAFIDVFYRESGPRKYFFKLLNSQGVKIEVNATLSLVSTDLYTISRSLC